MKNIDIHGMTNMELIRGGIAEWYWATDYIHGDLYEAEELDQNREDYAKEIRDMQQCIRRVTDKSVKIQAQEARNKELMREKFATIHRQAKAVRKNSRAITGYYNSMKEW